MAETRERKRTYKAALEASRSGMSAEAIHQGKCAAKRAARAARKQMSLALAEGFNIRKRTPQEQLSRLDFRLGVGIGAVRERKRLLAQINTGVA